MEQPQFTSQMKVAEEIVSVLERHDCRNANAIIALNMVLRAVLDTAPDEIRPKLKQVIVQYVMFGDELDKEITKPEQEFNKI